MSRIALLAGLALVAVVPFTPAADVIPTNKQYQAFVMKQAAELRKNDRAPATLAEWAKHEAELRKNLFVAWGGDACFLPKPCDLDPRQHGEPLKRDGYTVEKLTIQTRPGVRMTANLYVPDGARKKPAPAILCVHGHWRGAKQDPVVQSRCIGAAMLGFVVLCVDAFGAGERGVGTALGEYHGDMTAATLLPLGLPLSGLQVYENMRAVDYLESRPEVDRTKIGITGASGGGNQTMYAGAWDKRFKAVMPVCSVGNYQAYLHTACCMCEVVPGALKFTEEWAILALVAPRALCVVNATKDGIQFSVGEAKKSLALTKPVFKLFNKEANLVHAIFESPHDYSKAMRETMYGFMTLHLKDEGKGDPIPEPKFTTEKPEDLRCFPGDTRPKDFMTIPKFAASEGKKLRDAAAGHVGPEKLWDTRTRLGCLIDAEGLTHGHARPVAKDNPDGSRTVLWEPAAGVTLTGRVDAGRPGVIVVLLNLDGAEAARKSAFYSAARRAGVRVATFDLRGTGSLSPQRNRVGRAPDHNAAEWALWLGRPMVHQWLYDIRSFVKAMMEVDTVHERGILFVGEGPAGLLALASAGTSQNAVERGAAVINAPVTLVTDQPYEKQWLGLLAAGFLRDFGDVPHVAALGALTPLAIAGGTDAQGRPLTEDELRAAYKVTLDAGARPNSERRILFTTPERLLAALGVVAADERTENPFFEPGAKLKKLAGGGAAGEGPVWDPKIGILTSGEKGIYQYTPDGQSKLWREKAGTNGLLFDRNGDLICCEPVARSVSRITRDGKRTVLTDSFGGKKYNQPNDVTIDSHNRIYFSDPCYGKCDLQQLDEKGNSIQGVYRIDRDGKVSRIIGREVERANGVLVSADDKYLFVADNNNSNLGGARKLYRFDLKADGTVNLKSQKLLYDWGKGRGPDGLKQDVNGRLYVAGGLNKPNPPAEPAKDVKGGIYVIDPQSGKLLAFVAVPTDEVTNCAFGGADRKTLYITGGGTLYSIRTTTPGRVIWPRK